MWLKKILSLFFARHVVKKNRVWKRTDGSNDWLLYDRFMMHCGYFTTITMNTYYYYYYYSQLNKKNQQRAQISNHNNNTYQLN